MSNHEWRNNHFHFGEWEGRETCLMEWKCFKCGELITLPDSYDTPETDEPCKRKRGKRLKTKWRKL